MNQDGHAIEHGKENAIKLANATAALLMKYVQSGGMDVLNEAIHLFQQIRGTFPMNDSHQSFVLEGLGYTLMRHYQHNGDMDSLAECTSLYRDALVLHPHGHPNRGGLLNNLASALRKCYENSGDMGALAECTSLYRDALALHHTAILTVENCSATWRVRS